MTTFKCEIEMNNAAFDEDEGRPEIGRILRQVADDVESGGWSVIRSGVIIGNVYDTNGNNVGSWTIRTIR